MEMMEFKSCLALLLLIMTLALNEPVSARRRGGSAYGRQGLPIRSDLEQHATRHEERRRKASECRFGDQTFELEQTWHPDLGAPFGIMYCVHCECVPIHKKRRIVGRVQCKNIKTQCPKAACPDPILLPGRCCKICPGSEDENPDLAIEVDLKREEEERNGRHYASLLSQKSSLASTMSTTTHSATARLYFRKKTLTYSFVTSQNFGKVKLLTFMDLDGNIIEEFPLQTSHYQNETGKICGSWQRLPRRYRKQLRRDEIYAQLTNEQGEMISGKIGKHYGLRSEHFSALATSALGGHAAATAIVTFDAGTGSVHANLLLSGLFETNGEKNVGLEVKFQSSLGNETRVIMEELVIPKVDNALTTIDFTTVLGEAEMNALGEGRLSITIHAKNAVYNQVSGYIVPRFTCDIFDSVLSTIDEDVATSSSEATSPAASASSEARGVAWMQMEKSGLVKYFLNLQGLEHSNVTSIQIDNGRKSQRLLRIAHELGPMQDTQWVNGTFRMNSKDIDAFYHANLYINVASENDERELRGRIVQHFLGPAQEFAIRPILLKSGDSSNATVSGLAWLTVDTTCRLHYQVRVHGVGRTTESRISLEDHPMRNLKALNLVPGRQLDLQDFRGFEASGHQDSIHKLTMARMNSGDATLKIESDNFGSIKSKIEYLQIPEECLPRFSRNDLEMMPGFLNDLGEENEQVAKEYSFRCAYENTVYEDGSQWKATHEACKMCSCQRGSVVCDEILCPTVTCEKPFLPEGECCPLCNTNITTNANEETEDQGTGCFLEGDQILHPPGSKWHPYIPPFGFSRCATCTCDPESLKVECQSQKCPRLDCPADQQFRPDALACCKMCTPTTTPDPTQVAEEQIVKAPQTMPEEETSETVLDEGGCQWRDEVVDNGHTWNPRVLPYGEVQCVTCSCKDGHVSCRRRHCRPLTCRYKIYDQGTCCPRCAVNRAETKRAKRLLRILKLKQVRRLRRMRQNEVASSIHEELD